MSTTPFEVSIDTFIVQLKQKLKIHERPLSISFYKRDWDV
jgi:hypothetical protein